MWRGGRMRRGSALHEWNLRVQRCQLPERLLRGEHMRDCSDGRTMRPQRRSVRQLWCRCERVLQRWRLPVWRRPAVHLDLYGGHDHVPICLRCEIR